MGEKAALMRREACGVGALGCGGTRDRHPSLIRQVVPARGSAKGREGTLKKGTAVSE